VRDWFNISKAIGFILTITGLLLTVTFVQIVMATSWTTVPLPWFVVLAIGVMMTSVGVRYILKTRKQKPGEPTPPGKE
jgi:hypothetical protein